MKTILPLWLICLLSFATFCFDTTNLSDRMSVVCTGFLSATATMYVLGDTLPKIDVLTRIDFLVIGTLGMYIAIGGFSCYLKVYQNYISNSDHLNWFAGMIFGSVYIVLNLITFVPVYLRRNRQFKTLQKCYGVDSKSARNIPYSVDSLSKYFPVSYIINTLDMVDQSKLQRKSTSKIHNTTGT